MSLTFHEQVKRLKFETKFKICFVPIIIYCSIEFFGFVGFREFEHELTGSVNTVKNQTYNQISATVVIY